MPPSTAHLFHPKKKPIGSPSDSTPNSQEANGSRTSTPKRPRVPRPKPKQDNAEDATKPSTPEGPFSEFRLMSSALNGWKYDVMKFDSRKAVDINEWEKPVKLNRKEMRREVDTSAAVVVPQAVGPMLGPDGKPVIGVDGRVVMVDADGKPIRAANGVASGGPAEGAAAVEKGKDKEKPSAAKKKFQKKTKQVFLVPDEVRQLRREERHPWVMEDATKSEVWVGKMEEVSRSVTHAMFMPAPNDVFKFVPAHRWYKFQKKPHYHVPNLEEAESLMSQIQKNKDPERWLLRKRNGVAPSKSTSAMFKSESAGTVIPSSSNGSLVHMASQSRGPGGRKLKTVDSGANLFGDDDDDDDEGSGSRARKIKKEMGQEGDLDELDFEEDFADDEEKVEADGEDDEMKELEERLKREYKQANKTREGYIDESEEEEDPKLSGAGKDMHKLMKKLEKGTYDDSDEDKNPYASSEEEEEEEEPAQAHTGPAIQPHEPRTDPGATSQTSPSSASGSIAGTKTPNAGQNSPGVKPEGSSRASSPNPPASSHGGHSVVAKRATSPKAPKLKSSVPSRSGSPLTGAGSRATSPTAGPPGGGSRASSPVVQGQSQGVSGKPSNKRKATDEPISPTNATGGAPVKVKKRKAQAPAGELEEQMLIDWLKNTPNATTRDCIHHFTPYLTSEEKKQSFTKLVKEVATLKAGILVLRNSYRGSGAASTPPASTD